jgi:hypothetical protein
MKSTQLRLALFTVGILIFSMNSSQAQGMLDAGKSLFGGGKHRSRHWWDRRRFKCLAAR